jgi:hypothetical protein
MEFQIMDSIDKTFSGRLGYDDFFVGVNHLCRKQNLIVYSEQVWEVVAGISSLYQDLIVAMREVGFRAITNDTFALDFVPLSAILREIQNCSGLGPSKAQDLLLVMRSVLQDAMYHSRGALLFEPLCKWELLGESCALTFWDAAADHYEDFLLPLNKHLAKTHGHSVGTLGERLLRDMAPFARSKEVQIDIRDASRDDEPWINSWLFGEIFFKLALAGLIAAPRGASLTIWAAQEGSQLRMILQGKFDQSLDGNLAPCRRLMAPQGGRISLAVQAGGFDVLQATFPLAQTAAAGVE